MTAQTDPYVRVYTSIISDPKFAGVYGDDKALATWLRLLIIADSMYPAPGHLPLRVDMKAVEKLAKVELIDLLPGDLYRFHGLEAERESRSRRASESAQLRWSRPREEGGKRASRSTRFKVLERDGFRCYYCGRTAPDVVLDVDHKVPVREGGKDDLDNLVAACVDCNTGKSGHPLADARNTTNDARVMRAQAQGDIPNDASRTEPSLAEPSRAEPSQADPSSDEPPDALDVFARMTGSFPSSKVIPWINELCETYGEAEVCTAMAQAWTDDDDRGTLIGRVRDRLAAEKHRRDKAYERRERAREKREQERIEEMPIEKRAENLARLRAEMVKSGLLSKEEA